MRCPFPGMDPWLEAPVLWPDVHNRRVAAISDAFNGKVSQRIAQKGGDPSTLGISQGGKGFEAGEPLRCSMRLRARGVEGPVRVILWGSRATCATAELQPTESRERREATLTPAGADSQGTLTILLWGPGTLWIDAVSLMPVRAVHGWRADVSATLVQKEDRIAIFAVNPSLEPRARTLDLTAFEPLCAEVTLWTLRDTAMAGERDVSNSWREPERIRTVASTTRGDGGTLVHEFPALSLTVLEIDRREHP